MDVDIILKLVKSRLGISSSVRDEYLQEIIRGVISELEKSHGVTLDPKRTDHVMFVCDYSTWRYNSADNSVSKNVYDRSMPRDIQWRLHNLIISSNEDGDTDAK